MKRKSPFAAVLVAVAILFSASALAQQQSSGQTHEGHRHRQADRAMHGTRLNDYDRMMDRARDRFGKHRRLRRKKGDPDTDGQQVSETFRQEDRTDSLPAGLRAGSADLKDAPFVHTTGDAGDPALTPPTGAAPRSIDDSADARRPDAGPGETASN